MARAAARTDRTTRISDPLRPCFSALLHTPQSAKDHSHMGRVCVDVQVLCFDARFELIKEARSYVVMDE